MVWGVISFDRQTLLVVISGTLTAQWYLDNIILPVVLPFHLLRPGLIFQHYNAPPHTVRVAMNCLQACTTLSLLARLSDLSPTEHIWVVMRRRL